MRNEMVMGNAGFSASLLLLACLFGPTCLLVLVVSPVGPCPVLDKPRRAGVRHPLGCIRPEPNVSALAKTAKTFETRHGHASPPREGR
jgi:hypothetical protein